METTANRAERRRQLQADARMMQRALRLIIAPGGVVEIRAIYRGGRIDLGYFDDFDKAGRAAEALSATPEVKGVYFTLNRLSRDILARSANHIWERVPKGEGTKDHEVEHLRWLLIDCDIRRKVKNISATNEEKYASRLVARAVREYLRARGWPDPAPGDSGNGYHLLYRVSLDNTKENVAILRRVLLAIADAFDSPQVEIDRGVFNPSRIDKFYGTAVKKGDDTIERPWRLSSLLDPEENDATLVPVSPEHLTALAGEAQEEKADAAHASRNRDRSGAKPFDIDTFIARHLADVAGEPNPYLGGRKWILSECPLYAGHDHPGTAIIIQFPSGGLSFTCRGSHCQGWGWADLREKFEPTAAKRSKREQHNGDPSAARANAKDQDEDGRPFVTVKYRELRDERADALDAIARANRQQGPQLFNYAGAICRVRKDTGPLRIEVVTVSAMVGRLAEVANWGHIAEHGPVHEAPPEANAKDLLHLAPLPPEAFPPLRRVTEIPLLTADGVLISDPGYHDGIYYAPLPGFYLAPVPDKPTPAQIAAARDFILDEVLGGFPFERQSDRANAFAACVETVMRDAINGPSPLRVIESPLPGTGKGLLAQTIGAAAMAEVPATAFPRREEEVEKKITTLLLRGSPVVLWDNLMGFIASPSLSLALTARHRSDRLLGGNREVSIPVSVVWLATANNALLSDDNARRSVLIRLNAHDPHPELRTNFEHPGQFPWLHESRAQYLHALLTIARTWVAAGRPRAHITMGSYEQWAAIMGGVCEVAGVTGFLDDREDLRSRNEQGAAWLAFLNAWVDVHGVREVTISEIFDLAAEHIPATLDGNVKEPTERSQKSRLGRALAQRRGQAYELTDPGNPNSTAIFELDVKADKHKKVRTYALTRV